MEGEEETSLASQGPGEGEESRQGEYEGEEMAEEGERMERGEEEGDEGEDIALESTGNALNLQYVLGFNKQIPGGVHDLTGPDRTELFYSAGHTGVIYDYEEKKQKLLQGHCNEITATACSTDKEWLVTGDVGPDSMLIVWESRTGIPHKNIYNPHPLGVGFIAISPDNRYMATLSWPSENQSICIWDRESESKLPIASTQDLPKDIQYFCVFNSNNIYELATNGKNRVLFWFWEEGAEDFEFYAPALAADFKEVGSFTQTAFIPDSDMVVSGTVSGDIVVWDKSLIVDAQSNEDDRRGIKVVHMCNTDASINVLTVQGEHLVAGFSDGNVRFYDSQFRIVAWFEELKMNKIMSISFSSLEASAAAEIKAPEEVEKEAKREAFECPDFLVADSWAMILRLRASMFEEYEEKKDNTLLAKGHTSPIFCLAAHPRLPLLAIAEKKGLITIWNYETKENSYTVPPNKIDHLPIPTAMIYTPNEEFLVVGTATSELKFLLAKKNYEDSQKNDVLISSSSTKLVAPTQIIVSSNSLLLATRDDCMCVSLFKYDKSLPEWLFNGKVRSHKEEITAIALNESTPIRGDVQYRLFSIGKDRRFIEYDIHNSTESMGLPVLKCIDIEQELMPTSLIMYPPGLVEDELVLEMNSDYKMKLWDPNEVKCRKTCLGPTYGGYISKLQTLESDIGDSYLIYATQEKVIGLIKLPIDGNPNNTIGLIAHPKGVADIVSSPDGRYIFTCGGITKLKKNILQEKDSMIMEGDKKGGKEAKGKRNLGEKPDIAAKSKKKTLGAKGKGKDQGEYFKLKTSYSDFTVNMWAVDVTPIEQAVMMGGEGIEPYISLIPGGRESQTYKDMLDFFYYAQIRSKDEDTTKKRKLDGQVPLKQVPYLMRAMGYFPTDYEIENMKNEVKYSTYAETGTINESIDMDMFIRLFVNHRPIYGIAKNNLVDAFKAISNYLNKMGDIPEDQTDMLEQFAIQKEDLLERLREDGERIPAEKLQKYQASLLSDPETFPGMITPDVFAEQILGFEEIEDMEDEEEMLPMNPDEDTPDRNQIADIEEEEESIV